MLIFLSKKIVYFWLYSHYTPPSIHFDLSTCKKQTHILICPHVKKIINCNNKLFGISLLFLYRLEIN